MYQIAVIEDDRSLRERFVTIINQHVDLNVVFSTDLLADSLAWFSNNSADVLLVDLGLPDGDGVDLIRYCRQRVPAIEIMVVSVFGDEKNVLNAIEAGATGYLLKNEPRERLYESIIDLVSGGSPISPAIARMIIKRVEHNPRPESIDESQIPKLSKRETDVLRCLVTGMSYQEVADQLTIKIDTVRTYIKSIYQKLEVRSRGQAVYQASRLGISGALSDK